MTNVFKHIVEFRNTMNPEKYKNRYRPETTRASWWNYDNEAFYFITICTKNRIQYFGKITGRVLNKTPIAQRAEDCWREIPEHYPFVLAHEFVVMPNHVHGIIQIRKDDQNPIPILSSDIQFRLGLSESYHHPRPNTFAPQSKNLAAIVRGFKIGVTTFARQNHIEFEWLPRYHDRIIRSEEELNNKQWYIKNNPKNWKDDEFHPQMK